MSGTDNNVGQCPNHAKRKAGFQIKANISFQEHCSRTAGNYLTRVYSACESLRANTSYIPRHRSSFTWPCMLRI
ncbi:hypothetical protein KM043_017520 [Ampulex compressa]|nr:hypothetical protein KM043_017520 [Ampulex compressa]